MGLDDIQPIAFESTPSKIATQLRRAILDGLPPGTQLSEGKLTETFSVSRAPLREAMQRLIQEGLLRSEQHRGVFVVELDAEDAADISVARHAVEREAASRVLAGGDVARLVTALEPTVADMEDGVDKHDWRAVVDADMGFHEALVAAARSKRLSRMYRTLTAEMRLYVLSLRDSFPKETWTEIVAAHRRLIEAFRRGADDEVCACLDEHLEIPLRDVGFRQGLGG